MNKVAFIFPGQGSQEVGMLANLIDEHPVVKNTLVEASDAIGLDVQGLMLTGPAEVLNQTCNTQPVLLAASVALWRLWCETQDARPKVMAGHSLGEYSALVCAGSLPFETALQLVKQRGQYMQEAVPPGAGAMAAVIGLDDERVVEVCQELSAEHNAVLSAVNFNSPGQVVVAGNRELVEKSIPVFKVSGARKVVLLPVSVPSHCELMKPASEQLAQVLKNALFRPPEIAVIQNVTADIVTDPVAIRENLIRQLYRPVRWTESVEAMVSMGVDLFFECGPGKVLTGLNKRIAKGVSVTALGSLSGFDSLMVR